MLSPRHLEGSEFRSHAKWPGLLRSSVSFLSPAALSQLSIQLSRWEELQVRGFLCCPPFYTFSHFCLSQVGVVTHFLFTGERVISYVRLGGVGPLRHSMCMRQRCKMFLCNNEITSKYLSALYGVRAGRSYMTHSIVSRIKIASTLYIHTNQPTIHHPPPTTP